MQVLRLLSVLLALVFAATALLAPGAEGAGSRASASHILVKSEKEALQLKERLAAGEDFATLAKAHSTCPSSRKGGSLGQFGPGQMVGECPYAAGPPPPCCRAQRRR
jgi:parvulin-like peptidyl-prolyl isomerase